MFINGENMIEAPKGAGLETLLELDGEVFPMDNGFWVKFIAHKTPVNKHIPHGIKYSLTLHDRYNQRVIGYDNAWDKASPKKEVFWQARRLGP